MGTAMSIAQSTSAGTLQPVPGETVDGVRYHPNNDQSVSEVFVPDVETVDSKVYGVILNFNNEVFFSEKSRAPEYTLPDGREVQPIQENIKVPTTLVKQAIGLA